MKAVIWTMCTSCIALILSGCADEDKYTLEDLSPNLSTTQAPHLADRSDAGDCTSSEDCPNPVNNTIDLYRGYFEGTTAEGVKPGQFENGYFEFIDSNCHTVMSSYGSYLGDIDTVAVSAKAGTPLKINVKRSNYSKIRPTVSVYDKYGQLLMTSQDRSGEGNTQIYMRAPHNENFYVAVEESENYNMGWSQKCHNSYYGGDRYGFLMQIERDSAPNDVDLGTVSGLKVFQGKLRRQGEVQYIHWTMSGTTERMHIKLTTGTGKSIIMSLIDTRNGQASWMNAGADSEIKENSYYTSRLEFVNNEYYSATLAIADAMGEYGYDYTLTITPETNSSED